MYQYDEIDHRIITERAHQFRGQVARRLSGEITEEEFKPLRLQNGLYQREKLRPVGRQIDAPCRARKELTSEFFFQERNAVGQGRLRNVALLSRLAEGTLLCGGFCEPQLAQVHL